MWVSYIPISICSLIIKIWKSQPGFHLLTLSSVTTRQWRLKQGWERRVHFPSCLHQAEDPPAAVTGSGHHPKCLQHTLYLNRPPVLLLKSHQFSKTPWFSWLTWKSCQRTSYYSSPSAPWKISSSTWKSPAKRGSRHCLAFFTSPWICVSWYLGTEYSAECL